MSALEETLALHIKAYKIQGVVREYLFYVEQSKRPSRFDFAIPDKKLAFEVEGGIWVRGRHVRPLGFIKDCKKYNSAALQGWRVFRFTPDMVTKGEAVQTILKALEATND